MAVEAGELIIWATVLGLLIGVIWSLKYLVILDRRIERMEEHMDRILHKLETPAKKR
ncbi:MAG: hypothetical protein QXQ79_02545 [Candidatus Nanoarchaeia archaeon]